VDADPDTLATALYARADDLLKACPERVPQHRLEILPPGRLTSTVPPFWMYREVLPGSTTSRLTLGWPSRLRPFCRSRVVFTSAHPRSWSTHTRVDCGWTS